VVLKARATIGAGPMSCRLPTAARPVTERTQPIEAGRWLSRHRQQNPLEPTDLPTYETPAASPAPAAPSRTARSTA
jgi:hypothetical protein